MKPARALPSAAASALLAAMLLGSWLPAGDALAAAREYRIDPVHTRVLFSVDHLGFSQALGTLSAPRGWLRFDPDDWSSAAVDVELDVAALDLGDRDWNQRMLRRDFLDAERHPVARFVSHSVEPIDARHARVHGELSVAGVQQPLVLDVRFNRRARHPLTLRSTVGFSATAQLSRTAFGMTAWQRVVGDSVDLRIEVEAQRGRRDKADAAPDDVGVDVDHDADEDHGAAARSDRADAEDAEDANDADAGGQPPARGADDARGDDDAMAQ